MASRKPRVFIASSKEQLEYARSIEENLHYDFETTVWTQEIFKPSQYPLESLTDALDKSDFGVFIMAPDDIVTSRGRRHMVPRDNIIFELGLFTGRLGRENTFVVTPRSEKEIHLPTDLLGLTRAQYEPVRSDKSLVAALGPPCNQIRRRIRDRFALRQHGRTGVVRYSFFDELSPYFAVLLNKCRALTLYFIHSRRWRENHHEALKQFLSKDDSRLHIFLPDLTNDALRRTLQTHFDDGPSIPGLIADAYRYFARLANDNLSKVKIQLFSIYPTYSFYWFDDVIVIAMYPATLLRRAVPTFQVNAHSDIGDFLQADLALLEKDCTEVNAHRLVEIAQLFESS
jgi:hypothetical protein